MYPFSTNFVGSLDIARTYALHHKHSQLSCLHFVYGMAKNPNLKCHSVLHSNLAVIEVELQKLSTASKSAKRDQSTNLDAEQALLLWFSAAHALVTEHGQKEIEEWHMVKTAPASVKPYFQDIDHSIYDTCDHDESMEMPDFLVHLNARYIDGKMDPVIGREREIRSILEVLGRKAKNNPILLGEAGVGKTAVVEGLAGLIVKKDVPEQFLDKSVYSLDIGALMAGTKYRGDFEERIIQLTRFVKAQNGRAIIFLDEIHNLIGAGKTEGAIDAANLLKPALARGDLKCIGATTHNEYQKYILSDSALDRRFRPIQIDAPSVEASIEILLGLQDRFEAHHGISIDQDALHSAVFFSEQYVPQRNLPDKAIDLIDEACSAKKLSIESAPTSLVDLESELRAKRTLSQTEKCSEELLRQIDELEQSYREKKAVWLLEVKQIHEFASLKKQLDKIKFEQENAEKEGDYEKASRLKFSEIPSLMQKISHYHVNTSLQKEDVAQVLSRQTGIPQSKILMSQQYRVLQLQDFLEQRVFGQASALYEISETLIMSHAGLGDTTRPMGSFLLQGPSGVGKTETAKALSEFFFEHADRIIRLDLSEYSEKHSVAKLIGAPSGYVGYDDGGILTEAVRQRPYAIILFDEVEKAHADFADVLLQILDDGRLTDNKGRTISFVNTCIIMTTNSTDIQRDFKPEVLGRLDGILTYKPLDASVMDRLIDRQLEELNQHLLSRRIHASLSDPVRKLLCSEGFSEEYGARPLRAYFRKKVLRPIAHRLLQESLSHGHIEVLFAEESASSGRNTNQSPEIIVQFFRKQDQDLFPKKSA